MQDSKHCSTPFAIDIELHFEDNGRFEHLSLNRSIIRALQYLTLTRPDIFFSINKLGQFLQAFTQFWSLI